jgi:hypothetical protein
MPTATHSELICKAAASEASGGRWRLGKHPVRERVAMMFMLFSSSLSVVEVVTRWLIETGISSKRGVADGFHECFLS